MYEKLERLSKRVLIVLRVCLLGIPLLVICSWIFSATTFGQNILGPGLLRSLPVSSSDMAHFIWNNKLLGICGSLIGLAPMLIGISWIIKLFKNYASGNIFTLANAKTYSKLGYLCLLSAFLFQPLSDMVLAVAISINYPQGHRFISINFDNTNLTAILCGIFLIVIAAVMQIGHQISEEQDLTI